MRTLQLQANRDAGRLWSSLLIVLGCFSTLGLANCAQGEDEIRLKNGSVLRGTELFTHSLTSVPVSINVLRRPGDDNRETRNIARVENGWQYIFFPVQQQVAVGKPGAVPLAPAPAIFKIDPPRVNLKRVPLASLGPITSTEPFSEIGVRTITMQGSKSTLSIVQAITLVAPDHVMVESLNCDWKYGVSLKSVPADMIEKLVRRKVKPADEHDRYGLAKFYWEAELYNQAFNELESISKDFANRKDLVDRIQAGQAELMNYFGSQIRRHLERRKRGAQHVLAEEYARKLMTQPLSGAVRQDVEQFIRNYEEGRQNIERAKLLLGDWQAKINDSEQEERLQQLRSEINEQLDFETLPRLDAFLKAESDKQYEPAERLAMAYSGWVLGSANAVTDLDQTLRFWDARRSVLEYLRTNEPSTQIEAMKTLKTTESVGPDAVMKLIPQLPPILDASDISPSVAHQVEVTEGTTANYWVMLPAEYSPHHNYPLVIALRAQGRTTEETLKVWAGEPGHPDLGNQRGYIVIAPEYVEKTATEYTFGSPAHEAVLNCLIDARKRFSVDSDRVFLAGHAMGADAAFDIGMAHADEFAGVLPIGGNATNYSEHYWMNGEYTSWYVVGKGYWANGVRDPTSNRVLNNMLTQPKFDVMLVEYSGRSGDNMTDEVPKFYDWMELAAHVRDPLPKQFQMRSMRKADNRFFWLTAAGLPRDFVLPLPAGSGIKVEPMDFKARITTAGNLITLPGLTQNYTIRLTPELVDFDKPVSVKIGGRSPSNYHVTPEIDGLLDDLRTRGDRKRLPLAVIRPK
ncbi:hypothetical protein [Schlesneria paludicola]|uniref:hypothetical protein n=1 Tax=Schlesneria paludicola TaxID=360056 RepID=UPI00029A5994|nr:hypothetical protein [Schlesneria paludicola]